MKTDEIKELFDQLDFDLAEPKANHELRFKEKLKKRSQGKLKHSGVIQLWLPLLSAAAVVAVVFLVFQSFAGNPFSDKQELANVSPELKQTQNFYAMAIETELENLKAEETPETAAIIKDALEQMAKLEYDYENLRKDLEKSGNDKRVIYAMISNFQQRIDLLKTVLEKVNTINTLKTTSDENNII